MALPASGQLSLSLVNIELGLPANAQLSLSSAAVRALAGVPSGQFNLSLLHGKSAAPAPSPGPGPVPAPVPTTFPFLFYAGVTSSEVQVGEGTVTRIISGYWPAAGFGVTGDTTFRPGSGTNVLMLTSDTGAQFQASPNLTLQVTGAFGQLAAFTYMSIDGDVYYPGDAGHSIPGNNTTSWIWSRQHNFSAGQLATVVFGM